MWCDLVPFYIFFRLKPNQDDRHALTCTISQWPRSWRERPNTYKFIDGSYIQWKINQKWLRLYFYLFHISSRLSFKIKSLDDLSYSCMRSSITYMRIFMMSSMHTFVFHLNGMTKMTFEEINSLFRNINMTERIHIWNYDEITSALVRIPTKFSII